MKIGTPSGLQLAFLSFAVILLAAPLSKYVVRGLDFDAAWAPFVHRATPLLLLCIALGIVAALAPGRIANLCPPVPRTKRAEVIFVAIMKMLIPMAAMGMMVTTWWLIEGGPGLEQRYSPETFHAKSEMQALALPGLVLMLLLGGLVAPVVEELLFRGFIYGAWERRFGWVISALMTSTLFALYHPQFGWTFLSSIIFIWIYRRTGTLRAPMFVHAVFNLSLWYPFMGQFIYPDPSRAVGDLSSWGPQLACATLVVMALPTYLVLAIKPSLEAPRKSH